MLRPALLPLVVALGLQPAAPAQSPTLPTFTEHVARIVFGRCAQCHRPGEAAPFPLLSYADVRKRGRNLLRAVEDRVMPPWHPEPGHGSFRHSLRLTDAEVATFRDWVKGGMVEGPPEKLPPLPAFTEGWQLGEPDLVLRTSAPFEVPAGGRDIYRNFAIPIGLPESRWITAIEVRPQARAVLHHVLFFVDAEREAQALDGQDGKAGFSGMRLQRAPMIGGWAVGGRPEHLPDGLAVELPANSDLVLQCHFHPSGKKEKEQTTIGLYFAKEPPKRTLVTIQLPPFFGFAAGLDIPAGEKEYRLADSFALPCDVDAVTIGGHAHMLCRSMRMDAELPDGGQEPLLYIKDWDFDWQGRYTYETLVRLPKETVLRAEIVYDNSADNEDNPNRPPKRVRWGRESTDEMGSISLMVVPAAEEDLGLLRKAVAQKNAEQAVARAEKFVDAQFQNLDTNRDGKLQKDEVPARLRPFFDRLDADRDGQLSRSEAKAIGGLAGELGGGTGGGGDDGGKRRRGG